jgi:hypothetical protein
VWTQDVNLPLIAAAVNLLHGGTTFVAVRMAAGAVPDAGACDRYGICHEHAASHCLRNAAYSRHTDREFWRFWRGGHFSFIYVLGFVAILSLPEIRGNPLPDSI